jgi:hypothetical protein
MIFRWKNHVTCACGINNQRSKDQSLQVLERRGGARNLQMLQLLEMVPFFWQWTRNCSCPGIWLLELVVVPTCNTAESTVHIMKFITQACIFYVGIARQVYS